MARPLKNHSKFSKTALWPQNFFRLRRAKKGFALAPPGIGYPGRHHHTRRSRPLVETPGRGAGRPWSPRALLRFGMVYGDKRAPTMVQESVRDHFPKPVNGASGLAREGQIRENNR